MVITVKCVLKFICKTVSCIELRIGIMVFDESYQVLGIGWLWMKRILNLYVKERGSPLPLSLFMAACVLITLLLICVHNGKP